MKLTKAQKRALVAAMTAALFAPTPLAQLMAGLSHPMRKRPPRKRRKPKPSGDRGRP